MQAWKQFSRASRGWRDKTHGYESFGEVLESCSGKLGQEMRLGMGKAKLRGGLGNKVEKKGYPLG